MLSFTGATGNLFPRLATMGSIIKQLYAYQQTQLNNMVNTSTGVEGQFNGEPDIQAINGNSYISLLNSASSGIASTYQNMAEQTINRMVFRDNPRLGQTLTSLNTVASIQEVIRQMGIAGASVLAMNVTAAVGTFEQWITNIGNGVMNCSVRRPLDGRVMENAFSEALLFTCTQDSYTGGAAAGNEGFTMTGTGQQSDPFAFNWPLGSNCSLGVSAIDGNSDNSSGNLLTNSGMESWTANVPDKWTLNTGTAGTSIFKETSIIYDGLASAGFLGDASTQTEIRQQFNSTTGTSGALSPLTQYSVCLFLRRDGNTPSQGTLTLDLIDSGVNTLNDEGGNPNSFNVDLTTLSTVFMPFTGVFRTPIVMPSTTYLRVKQSVPYDTGCTYFLDKMSMGLMSQCYTGGPSVALHAGSTPFVENDYGYTQITNSRGAGGVLNSWQCLICNQLLPIMASQELLLPSSNTPTISDSWIL